MVVVGLPTGFRSALDYRVLFQNIAQSDATVDCKKGVQESNER